MQQYLISQNIVQAIAQYLGTKPFNEVQPFIAILDKLQPVTVNTPEEKPAETGVV